MKTQVILLRVMLIVVTVTGLFSGIALVMPWASTVAVLQRLGIEGAPAVISAPIIEYWLLMMAAVSCVVGYGCLVAALNPQKHKHVLPLLGWGLIFVGVASGYHGFRLRLPPWPFYSDLIVCAICGPGIVWLARRI